MENSSPNNEFQFPELLAAYADGELDAAGRTQVEAWLAEHPEARGELESQQQFSRRNRKLWRASFPNSPSDVAWSSVLTRVQRNLQAPTPAAPRTTRRSWLLKRVAPVAGLAAAVVLAVYMSLPKVDPMPGRMTSPLDSTDRLVLANDNDIDIVFIQDADTTTIVVGRPPLAGTMVLAGVGDVELKNVVKAEDGMMPRVQMNDGAGAPMIIAPITGK